MSDKNRNWCFTLNNYSEEELAHFDTLDLDVVKYCLIGEEVGESGTPHLQGYIVFHNQCRRPFVNTHVGVRAHVELARGNVKHNFDYCTKDGKFWEFGVRPKMPKEKGEMEKKRYKDAKRAAEEGRFDDIDADIYMRHYSTIKRIRHDKCLERKLTDTTETHEWYYGPAGTGKSRKARVENPEAYLKNCNKWWDGYVDQDVVIVDDFDQAHSVLVHHLKHWADRYPFQAEVKGSAMTIRPRKIILTSNYHPRDIWTDPRDLEPILRRFKVTHFPSAFSVPIHPPLPQEQNDIEADVEVIDLTQ